MSKSSTLWQFQPLCAEIFVKLTDINTKSCEKLISLLFAISSNTVQLSINRLICLQISGWKKMLVHKTWASQCAGLCALSDKNGWTELHPCRQEMSDKTLLFLGTHARMHRLRDNNSWQLTITHNMQFFVWYSSQNLCQTVTALIRHKICG